jgi:hypothetical protein
MESQRDENEQVPRGAIAYALAHALPKIRRRPAVITKRAVARRRIVPLAIVQRSKAAAKAASGYGQ